MKTMEIYKNYGCLAAEKRCVYTYGAEHATAVSSDKITVVIPEGWEADENEIGDLLITAPWGWVYTPNEIPGGDDFPHFIAVDKDGKKRMVRLEEIA